jgi:hypothetical protein
MFHVFFTQFSTLIIARQYESDMFIEFLVALANGIFFKALVYRKGQFLIHLLNLDTAGRHK